MDVFQAAEIAREFISRSISENVVQCTGVVAVKGNQVLKFRTLGQAVHTAGGNGYIFSYIYRNNQLEVTPEN